MSTTIETVPGANEATDQSLGSNRDFLNLWIAESISQVGSQVSIVALPLLAILTLGASPAQMGFLTAAGTAPALLIGLFVGVWVDRVRRRPLMIAADIASGALLLSIPVIWWFGALRIEMLYAIALLTGSLTVLSNVAWLTLLPSVVRRSQLVEANSKLHVSASVAQVSGPGAGGALVGAVGAPFAVLIDALSFFASAVFVYRVSPGEVVTKPVAGARNFGGAVLDGLSFVYRNDVLRALVYSKIVVTYSAGIFFAVYVLFMADNLGLGATLVGVVLATGGVGSLLGAAITGRISSRIGPGRTVVAGQFSFGVFGLTMPLAVLFPPLALAMVVLSEFSQWMAHIIAQVNELAIRQALVPDEYLGRVNSVFQFFGRGMTPIGALTGGLLGELIGVPLTLVVASGGFFLAFLFVLASPVRGFAQILDD